MDIEMLEDALLSNDTNLYFAIREHFPLELIEAEVALMPKQLKVKYLDLERQWRRTNLPIPEIEIGSHVIIDQPGLQAHGKSGVVIEPDQNILGWYRVKLDNSNWIGQYHPHQLILQEDISF